MSFLENDSSHNERFSLLLLEPGEIYFEDFSAYYYPPTVPASQNDKKRQRGRLKICSKSIVFDPTETIHPILKFSLTYVKNLEDCEPGVLSRFCDETLVISSMQSVEMREKNVISPYRFIKTEAKHTFSLNFAPIDNCLSQMCQLHRASTLPITDQNIMIQAIIKGRQNRVKFDTSWLDDLSERLLLELRVDHIQPLVTNPGRLMLTSSTLYFQPFNNIDPVPVVKIHLSKISSIFKRRFLLRHIGLEIYTRQCSRSQMYLSFKLHSERDAMYELILQQAGVELEPSDPGDAVLRWQNGQLSNYDYLLYLNSLGDRSFNDLTQYPIMPWVVADYTSNHLDLTTESTFRDLAKPIGALNENRLAALKERCREMPEPKFLYGSHYSTPGYVLFYLTRVAPEYVLCLQNGRFDQADRMFNSMADTWNNCLSGQADFKELIPEFYSNSTPHFLSPNPVVNFGMRSDRRAVGGVKLPPWASSPTDMVRQLRGALESDWVSQRIHLWIDLVFGFRQKGQAALEADNVFYYLTYEGGIDLTHISDPNERASLEVQIMEFGQIPKQLFTTPHPQRLSPLIMKRSRDLPPLMPGTSVDSVVSDVLETTERTNHMTDEDKVGSSPSCLTQDTVKSLHPHLQQTLHKESVSAVTLSHDATFIFSASQDSLLKMYSIEDRSQLRSINFSSMALSCVALLPNETTILAGSWDNNIYVYSIEYGQVLQTLSAHDDAVSCMHWCDGRLFTASWDSTVKVWSLPRANHNQRICIDYLAELDHECRVTCLDYDAARDILVTGTDGGTVHVWDTSNYQPTLDYHAHHGLVNAVLIVQDHNRVISCGSDSNLRMWDYRSGTEVFTRDLTDELLCMTLSGQCLMTGVSTGDIIVCDVMTAETHHIIHAGNSAVTSIHATVDTLVTGQDDGTITVWKCS